MGNSKLPSNRYSHNRRASIINKLELSSSILRVPTQLQLIRVQRRLMWRVLACTCSTKQHMALPRRLEQTPELPVTVSSKQQDLLPMDNSSHQLWQAMGSIRRQQLRAMHNSSQPQQVMDSSRQQGLLLMHNSSQEEQVIASSSQQELQAMHNSSPQLWQAMDSSSQQELWAMHNNSQQLQAMVNSSSQQLQAMVSSRQQQLQVMRNSSQQEQTMVSSRQQKVSGVQCQGMRSRGCSNPTSRHHSSTQHPIRLVHHSSKPMLILEAATALVSGDLQQQAWTQAAHAGGLGSLVQVQGSVGALALVLPLAMHAAMHHP
jgi:hypothetical protein